MQRTEVRFASFLSDGFITAIVVNPPERKLTKRTSVQCTEVHFSGGFISAIVVNPLERKLAKCTSVQWGKSFLKEHSYFHLAVFSQEFLKDSYLIQVYEL